MNFIEKNKIMILGFLGAIAVALQGFIGQPTVEWKAIGFAAFMAVLSYAANEWRGQGVTALGIIGTIAYTFVQLNQTGTFTWKDFILSALVAVITAVSGPPKPSSYETDPTIVRAKGDR